MLCSYGCGFSCLSVPKLSELLQVVVRLLEGRRGTWLAPQDLLILVPSHSLVYREQLPESAYMHQLLGLNLLFLLSQNRVAEFHTELERLPAKDIQTNVYIKHPVSLEQVRLGRGREILGEVGGTTSDFGFLGE